MAEQNVTAWWIQRNKRGQDAPPSICTHTPLLSYPYKKILVELYIRGECISVLGILHQRGSEETKSSWHRHFDCAIDYTYEEREFTGHGFLYGESLYLLYRCQGQVGPMRDNTDRKSTAMRVYRFSHSSFLTCLQYRVRICADWANVYRYAENDPESGDEAPESESGDETSESDSGDETYKAQGGGSRKRPRVTRRRYAQQLANASVGRV